MRKRVRIGVSLAVAAVFVAAFVVSPPPTRLLPNAHAQVVPSPFPSIVPTILPSTGPSPSPSPSDDSGGGSGKGGSGKGGDTGSGGSGGGAAPDSGGSGAPSGGSGSPAGSERSHRRSTGGGSPGRSVTPAFYSPGGSFSTAKLVAIAAELRALGWSEVAIRDKVYAPFILAGKAAWVDTWGAPRYGPAPGQIRSHEGQDVFCQYGEPVLAAARGSIEFDSGGLGGRVARLHLANGWYWYYAHLSGWNTERFHDGDRVRPGDVIGYCGNSGDAISSPPHVHFSLYDRDVRAHNPMRALVSWLHEAERHATRALARASGKRVQDISLLTLARRLGEGMLPDPARYEDSSLSPLAAGEPHLGEGVAGGFAGLVGAALSMHGDNSGWEGELPADHGLFVGGWSTPLAGRTSGPGEKSGGLKSRPAARLVGGTG